MKLQRWHRKAEKAARRTAQALVLFYRNTFKIMNLGNCRFYPSCSRYALLAFEHLPFFRAAVLIFKRISRCHPYHPGGPDPLWIAGRPHS